MENELARTPKESVPILGGDWNAQVGRGSQRQGISGKYGLKTETIEAGESLLDWCEEHQLQHVNSYFSIRSRGTWFNQMHRPWYELDGFLIRASDRHQMVRRVATAHDMALSDHKPVWIDIWRKQKKQRPRIENKRTPQIDWERMTNKEMEEAYHKKTEENLNNEEEEEICGTKKRQIANPWTVGYEEELKSLHTEISTEVISRNELVSQSIGESHNMLAEALTASRGRLAAARKRMKKRLRQLERLGWTKSSSSAKTQRRKGTWVPCTKL